MGTRPPTTWTTVVAVHPASEATDLPSWSCGFDYRRPLPEHPKASSIYSDVLNANDLLTFVRCDGVPDGHTVRGQVQFVRTWQRVIHRKRVRQDWDGFIQQVEDRALDCPSQWFGQGLDLLPRGAGKAGETIAQSVMPHASAS
jgi:hypothetical protein